MKETDSKKKLNYIQLSKGQRRVSIEELENFLKRNQYKY